MRHIPRLALAMVVSITIAGCLHAPMPWSHDGKWIAYTVEVRPTARILQPGWIFDPQGLPGAGSKVQGRPSSYRLWASRKDNGASVLLEESAHPLTAPGWSSDGRGLAFGRIVVEPDGSGRFEVVILEGPSRRRVVSSRPMAEIGPEAARLHGQAIAWSPDGRYLAIPQLNPLGLAIIRADNGRQVNAINDGFLPSWSPDGSRLAFFLRGTVDTLNCLDGPLAQARVLAEVGQASQAPAWTRDGLTLVVVARRSVDRGTDPPGDLAELIRVRVDTGQLETIKIPGNETVMGRDRSDEGVSIAFDDDNLFCSTVAEGAPYQITWYHPRENAVYKKFAMVDFTTPMASLSISPDGSTLAARVGPVDRPGAPALCDLGSSDLRTRLIAPDDSSRIEWIATLLTSARSILAGLPTASADPKSPTRGPLDRPTMLPVLGEIDPNTEVMIRLRRLGRIGRPLCDRPVDALPPDPLVAEQLDEARLFFDYLSENYSAALGSLETLEARLTNPDQLFRLLSVRIQIFMAQGKLDRAGESIAFLRSLRRSPARRVEWDGTCHRLSLVDSSREEPSGWPDYLAWRASRIREMLQEERPEPHNNPDAPRPDFGFDLINPKVNPLIPDRPFLEQQLDPGPRRGVAPRPGMPVQ